MEQKKKTEIKVGPFVGSYVTLYEPRAANDDSSPKYGMSMVVPKNIDPKSSAGISFEQLKRVIDMVAREKFGPNYKDRRPAIKLPIRDGDADKPDKKEYANSFFFNCSSKRQPGVVDRNLKKIMSDRVYSGNKYVVQVNVYPFDRKDSKGIALGLNNVLLAEMGERIDGRQDAAEAFRDFEESSTGDGNPLD
jgi:hypothetical protein